MRAIGAVTTSRSDFGSLLPVLQLMKEDQDIRLLLFVSGTHLSVEYGLTVRQIEAEGFEITQRIQTQITSDSQRSIAVSLGKGTIGFADSLARNRPDILVIVGDRFELLSAACAALALGIPIAHISGGDVTEGAIDNQVRHAISKISHLHFVAMKAHARRLSQMGEEPWRVIVTGDPALDLLEEMELLSRAELSKCLGLELESPVLLVSIHPTTLGSADAAAEADSILAALSHVEGTLVLTYPNGDYQSGIIIDRLRRFVATRPRARLYQSLGQVKYASLMAQADLMVGNSSSGIWEAPSFCLPAVNVGERQRGRFRAGNVIDVAPNADLIYLAIQRGLEPSFRASLRGMRNPYGDGQAAPRIVGALKHLEIGPQLLQKAFVDLPFTAPIVGSEAFVYD